MHTILENSKMSYANINKKMNLFEYIFPSFVFWLCHLTERIMKHTNKSKIVNIFAKISQIDK